MAKEGWHFLPPVNKKIPNISYHGRRGELIQEKDRCCRKRERAEVFDVMVGHPCDRAQQQTQSPCKCSPDPTEANSKSFTNFSKVKISS